MVKQIMVTDEAYERLRSLKKQDKDSFSKVILRELSKKSIKDFAGTIPTLKKEDLKDVRDSLKKWNTV